MYSVLREMSECFTNDTESWAVANVIREWDADSKAFAVPGCIIIRSIALSSIYPSLDTRSFAKA